jgi:hypothetical protein
VRVEHPSFNYRALRGNGESIGIDLRKVLYANLQ